MESRFTQWLLGRHPFNTIFNYNWVNVHPMIRTFRKLQPLFKGRIADLGAGSSPYYDIIAGQAELYVAMDYIDSFSQQEMRRIERVAGTIEAIPLADVSIDTVFCSQVLCQTHNPKKALIEIARILRPKGYAIISVPHISPLHSEPNDLYRFTPYGMSQLIESTELRIHNIYTQGQLFASFALSFAMNLILEPINCGHPMRIVSRRKLACAPLIAFCNTLAFILDAVLPFNRTPVNIIAIATKP